MFGKTSNRKTSALFGGIAAAGILVAAVVVMTGASALAQSSSPSSSDKPAIAYSESRKYMDYSNGVFKVRAGAGGAIAPLTQFFPKVAEIKAGETVVWYNPTRVGEPHTVSFITNQSYFADIEAPFVISNSSNITPLNPAANADPVTIPAGPPGKTTAIIANARVDAPVAIDKAGNVKYMPPNSNYTMNSDERYVNSGWIWPKGMNPPGTQPIETFAVKFTKPGTYNYVCLVHPWMTGKVIVH
ncbi:MAG: hypothetical protein ABI361_08200 [Nitrososphaera sp.]|jgi:plastocyanin